MLPGLQQELAATQEREARLTDVLRGELLVCGCGSWELEETGPGWAWAARRQRATAVDHLWPAHHPSQALACPPCPSPRSAEERASKARSDAAAQAALVARAQLASDLESKQRQLDELSAGASRRHACKQGAACPVLARLAELAGWLLELA